MGGLQVDSPFQEVFPMNAFPALTTLTTLSAKTALTLIFNFALGLPLAAGECGAVATRRGEVPSVREAPIKARRAEPANLDWHYAIAENYVRMKDYASAQAVLRQALEADPSNTRVPFRLASLHEEMGNPFLALSVLKEASGREALRTESLMEMARLYCDMGQDWPALDCYLRAAGLGEDRAVTGMLNVGKRLFNQGDVRRAKEVFALIRTAFPKDLEVDQALADLGS